ncbi:MAG: hypothetical protein JRD39_07755 [Deltaproteobacteria bacterium]|jgi:hypothetical protein|nr:hypothetical protein [Deltaproteobacteria bacterium]
MKKALFLILAFLLFAEPAKAQTKIRIDDDATNPDFKVLIGKDVSYPDIKIRIGEDIENADFVVGITRERIKADLIISKSNFPDFTVAASDTMSSPDLKIRASEDEPAPDLKIQVNKHGRANYYVYNEGVFMSLYDLVVVLLPAVNIHTAFQHDSLKDLLSPGNKRVQ